MNPEFTISFYRTILKREWRWRVQAANNKIVADSGEGYKNRLDAEEMAARLFRDNRNILWK